MRSAIAPETMVAAVAQNTVWKIIVAQSPPALENRSRPPMSLPVPPNMMPKPMNQKIGVPRLKSIRFFMMILPAFLARVKPVSTIAKPACMKNTSAAPSRIQPASTACANAVKSMSMLNPPFAFFRTFMKYEKNVHAAGSPLAACTPLCSVFSVVSAPDQT